MSDQYKYVDADYIYTDPVSGVLRNLGNLNDSEDLLFFESVTVSKRLKELKEKPVKIKDSSSLFVIHKYLFQDVYQWAGERRKVEISKAGKQFFPTSHFNTALSYIDTMITGYEAIDRTDKEQISHKLAEMLDTINFLHPFREGNGRTQREFIRLLALEKGYTLSLNPADNVDVYGRYRRER